jgi:hypothetical protein
VKKLHAGKTPVKKIPRASKPRVHAFAAGDAAELRQFINKNLRGDCPGRIGLLLRLAKAIPGAIEVDDIWGGPPPDAREREYQARVLAQAALHFAAFHSMVCGLVETGPYPITWADGWSAMTLMLTAEFMEEVLRDMQHVLQAMSGGETANDAERRIKRAVGVDEANRPIRGVASNSKED